MQTVLIIVLWLGFLVCIVGSYITSSMLIFRLREGRPVIYAKIGSPHAFSRSAEFLWRLKPYEDQLTARDIKLRRLSLIFYWLLFSLSLVGLALAVLLVVSSQA